MNDTNPTETKHDFKDGANKAAEGVKNLADSLRKHDFKAELLEAFAEAKKNPSSILKKPDAPRPGKELAVAGLAAAVVLLLLLFVTSGAFFGVVCLVLGIGALLLGLLGLKTEGRAIAFASTGAGLLAILLSIGQIRSATRKPDPKDELIRLMAAQLAQQQSATSGVAAQQPIQQPNASAGENAQVAEALLARLKSAEARQDVQELAKVLGQLQSLNGPLPDGAEGWMASARDTLKSHAFGALRGGKDGQASVSATQPSSTPPPPVPSPSGEKYDHFDYNKKSDTKKDKFGHGFRTQDEDPPAGPSSARIDEVLPVLKKANIETMVIDLPNKVRLLLSKLPDGSFMGTFEITQDQWLAVMGGENPSAEDNVGEDHPVDSVWPSDCLAFVEKLNALPDVKKAGIQFRIPSEEEWEEACLAGSRDEFGKRLDGARVTESTYPEIAWCGDNMTRPADIGPHDSHPGVSHSVGRKQPNAFGLYDMHGNVEELVFEKRTGYSSKQGFKSKGGDWQSRRTEASHSGHVSEKSIYGPGQKPKPDITLGFRVAASVMDKDIGRILAAAEKVTADGGAAFFGFYPGMSETDAMKLASHYGLKVDDESTDKAKEQESNYGGNAEQNELGHCQIAVNPVTKNVIKIQFDIQSVQALTKENFRRDNKVDMFCAKLSKYVGELECIRNGKKSNNPNVVPEYYLYQRKTSNGTAVSFEEAAIKTQDHSGLISSKREVRLTLENTAAMASLETARMAAANNARIEAVEPVLHEKGIKTKTIELPGGVKLLLTQLPNERFMGTFEVTQAQYFSLMGTNTSQCVGADLPVDSVSVQDCLAFIEKANELPAVKEEDLRFRLPPLSAWEAACRAGTSGDYTRRIDGADITRDTVSDMTKTPANLSSKDAFSRRGSHAVGVTAPNAFGLYDMFGNVSEWVAGKVQDNPHHAGEQFHLGWSWNGMNVDPKIRANGNTDYYEYAAPDKTSASRGFRVSVVSMPRERQRAKDMAAKEYTLSNNGRIDAVKPVLEKAGIVTKVVELPGGIGMLLNKLPDGSWAAAFETTQAQWRSLLHDNPSSFRGDPCTDDIILEIWRSWKDENPERLRGTGLPVDCVSPEDCATFFGLLNLLPDVREADLTFHLPTMDEWLYIARAGAESKFAKPLVEGDSSVNHLGWTAENVETAKGKPGHLQLVGWKQPNAFGLYDVHGNAAEFAESVHGGGGRGYHAMGGGVNTDLKGCALERPLVGLGDYSVFKDPKPLHGFRVVATVGVARHLVDPKMAEESNAAVDAAKPALEAEGIETKVFDLPGGVKLLMNKLHGGLWAGTFEVTQAQFLSLLGENPSTVINFRDSDSGEAIITAAMGLNLAGAKKKKLSPLFETPWKFRVGNRPVGNVEKAGADAFLRALNALPCAKEAGLVFRLPSVAEWTKYSDGLSFATLKDLLDRAWLGGANSLDRATEADMHKGVDNSGLWTHDVGTRLPNRFGLYDMLGNVWEWTSRQEGRMEVNRLDPGSEGAKIHNMYVAGKFTVVGSSFKTMYRTDKSNGTESYRVESEKLVSADLDRLNEDGDIGFRVWAEPAAKWAESAKPAESVPSGPSVSPFVQAGNARIDAVKPVLDAAGIETKIVELPDGVRLLMNKLPNGAWIGAFEVTQAQFFALQGQDTSGMRGGDLAVDGISWNRATIFAAMINEFQSAKASGLHFRLPSSTEWEYACRGGGGIAPQGKPLEKGKGKLDDMGWYDKNSDIEGVKQSHRVGDSHPNAFGLYDMVGNVSELTSTAYVREGVAGSMKILRGGGFNSPKDKCTASWRGLIKSDSVVKGVGFRFYATEDGSGAKDEAVTFRDKEYDEAIK